MVLYIKKDTSNFNVTYTTVEYNRVFKEKERESRLFKQKYHGNIEYV